MPRIIKVRKCKYLVRFVRWCLRRACFAHNYFSNRPTTTFSAINTTSMQQTSKPEELSPYQLPTRFLGEINIVLSSLIILCSIGTIVNLYLNIPEEESHKAKMLDMGFIFFISLTLIISVLDIFLSVLLIWASKTASLGKSLLWQRFTLSILIAFIMLTVAFGVLLKTSLVILGLLPSLIYKPFAIWVVNGFIWDLRGHVRSSLETDPMTTINSDDQRKSTTVFILTKSNCPIEERQGLLLHPIRANVNANVIPLTSLN